MLGRALRKGFAWSASERRLNLLTLGYSTAAGVKVSPSTSLTAAAVYSATSLIAQTIAALPIRIIERDDRTRRPQRPPEAMTLWGLPNTVQVAPSFIETAVLSMLLWGNAYVFPRRRNDGNVFELWPLDPDRVLDVAAVKLPDSQVGVQFRVSEFGDLMNRPGKPVDLIHIPLMVPPGRIRGISPIEQLAELVGMSLSAQEHAARFLGDGVHMTGTIETAKELKQPQAEELWKNFQQMHGGPKNAGKVGVLTGGATFKSITIPPAELQFLEQMQYTDRRIASIYRVPPHMVGDVERSTSWGSGIEEQTIQFVQHTLLPIIRRIEAVFEATLLAGTRFEVRFVLNGLLRGSVKDRADFYRALWWMGVLSADDILELEDMPPTPDGSGQVRYVPLNAGPAGAPSDEAESRARALLSLLTGAGGDR